MRNLAASLGLLLGLGLAPANAAAQTQCVSNALAGGTVDHLTIPLQPCALSTNLLILTLAGTNTIAQPTLQMAGYPQQNIYTSTGTAPGIAALPSAGAVVLLTSTGSSWNIISGNSSTIFSGTLTVPNGGTGDTTLTTNGILIGQGTGAISVTAAGATGTFLGGNTSSPPSFKTISTSLVSSWNAGTTGLLPSSATTGAITMTGTLIPANGGTGLTSYATGDLIYASASATLAKLADVATGNVVLSGGVGVAPLYGKVGLTTHVSGTLPVANGGTGITSATSHGVLYGNGTSGFGVTAECTSSQVVTGVTGSAPVCSDLAAFGVASLSFGTTGLTPSTASAGPIVVAGTLGFANGGTSNTSYINGQLLIGNTATGGLSKATLTAGTNVAITNGAGTISIAATGNCATAGNAGQILTDNGALGCTSNADATFATGTLSLGVNTSEAGTVKLFGGTSGNLSLKPAAVAGTNSVLTFPGGTTDLSATGGTSQVVKQVSAGAALTVARLACSDLSDAGAGCSSAGGPAAITSKTASYNATSNAAYCNDTVTGSAAITATLPASPANNDVILFVACSNYSTYNLIIARNGNNIQGLAQNMTVNNDNAAFNLIFVTSYGWRLY